MNNQNTKVQLDISVEATFKGLLINCEENKVNAAWNLVESGADIEGVLHACAGLNSRQNNSEDYQRAYLQAKAL